MDVELIGFPLDLGAGRRGVDMGPTALRIAGLQKALERLGHNVTDQGNIEIPQPETRDIGDTKLRYLDEIAEACENLYRATRKACDAGRAPMALGGDHSMAMGSIAAVSDHCRENNLRLGVVWLDAHADMNTADTSPSGNIHGMPLSALLGEGHPRLVGISQSPPALLPEQVALVGVRSIDAQERARIHSTGVHTYTMRHIDELGMPRAMQEIVGHFKEGFDWLHVSFDVDFLDPWVAPGVGTAVRGGPNYRESHLVFEILSDTGLIRSADITELNPILDTRNTSAEVCVELVESLLGKRIL